MQERKAAFYVALGAIGMFLVCLGIGVLDLYGFFD